MTHTSKSAVGQLLRVTWRTVGSIITRVVAEGWAAADPFAGLRRVGIDEISYKKGHRYLMVVVADSAFGHLSRWCQRLQAFHRLPECGEFGARSGVGTEVQRDPVGGACLQGADLAGDLAVRSPALADQGGVGVGAGEADRSQVQVQPARVDVELVQGGEQQPAAQVLGDRVERLE